MAPVWSAIASATFELSELSGKIASTPSRSIRSASSAEVLGRGLRLGRLRGDDGADDVDPVAVGEVAEGVVIGDQLAPRGRDPLHAAGDAGVERPQLGQVGGGVAFEARAAGPGSAAISRRSISATAASALRGSCHQCGSNSDASAPLDSPGSRSGTAAPRSTSSASLPLSETTCSIQPSRSSPLAKTSFASRRRDDVAGPRLVLVRVGVRLEDLVDDDGVAADLADEVADLGRRRDHLDLPVAGARIAAAARREQSRRREAGGRELRRARGPSERPRRRGEGEDGPGDDRDRRPGRSVGLDREPEPDRALEGDQGDAGELPGRASAR